MSRVCLWQRLGPSRYCCPLNLSEIFQGGPAALDLVYCPHCLKVAYCPEEEVGIDLPSGWRPRRVASVGDYPLMSKKHQLVIFSVPLRPKPTGWVYACGRDPQNYLQLLESFISHYLLDPPASRSEVYGVVRQQQLAFLPGHITQVFNRLRRKLTPHAPLHARIPTYLPDGNKPEDR